eukprot:scaffold27762_cov21-Tisochrysis_lutea.AAC.1
MGFSTPDHSGINKALVHSKSVPICLVAKHAGLNTWSFCCEWIWVFGHQALPWKKTWKLVASTMCVGTPSDFAWHAQKIQHLRVSCAHHPVHAL